MSGLVWVKKVSRNLRGKAKVYHLRSDCYRLHGRDPSTLRLQTLAVALWRSLHACPTCAVAVV